MISTFLSQTDNPIIKHSDLMNRYFKDGKPIISDIADGTIKAMHILTLIDNEEMLYYENGIYHHDGDIKIKEVLNGKLGFCLSMYNTREVIAQIQAKTYIDRKEINNHPYQIHMLNGIFDIKENKYMEHTPDIHVTSKIPVIYNPKATCPSIDKFISEILDENDRHIIYELFGYCLYRGYPFQKAFVFVADGSNGKSVLINLFKAFIGDSNTSNVPLQAFGYDRFASADLYGKMVNSFSDLTDAALKNTGIFKALTGGDTITGQKKFKNRFSFVNYAKFIFSCNKLPSTPDDTDAYFRRWIIINFPNTFEGKDDDPNMLDKITTPNELSGLLNRALSELSKIISNGRLSYSETTEKTRERYNLMSNSLRTFVVHCVEISRNDYIIKDDFFNAYLMYCGREKLPNISKTMVGKTLPRIIDVTVIPDDRPTTSKGRKTIWRGIRFKAGSGYENTDMVGVDIEDNGGSLDDYDVEIDSLSQHDRINIVRDILINNPDGITEKNILSEIDGRMTDEYGIAIIENLKKDGTLTQIGDIIQWNR